MTSWEDAEDQWTSSISEAHPTRSGSHESYAMAMEMVGHRRSKSSLVALVSWLLVQKLAAVEDERAATVRYLRVWADSVRDNEAIDGQLQALVSTTHAANIESGEHIKRPAQDTIHALSIDPSKEQGK